MRLTRLFKSRACAVAAAAAMFLCLAAANAGAQDDATLWKIWNALLADDGAAVVRLIRQNGIDIDAPYYFTIVGGVSSDPNRDVDEGYATALSGAVARGCPNVVKALLDAGADVNARNRRGSTALSCARVWMSGSSPIQALNILISYGADLNAQDDWGNTALMDYAGGGRSDYAKILLDAGADVNIRNNEGLTALMIAEREGNAETAQLLRGARGYR